MGRQGVMRPYGRRRPMWVMGVISLFCLVLPADGYSAPDIRHIASITGGQEMGAPETVGGIFCDEVNGRIYMTDPGGNRILSFDSELRFLAEFRGGEPLNWPTSLVRDSRGRFFTAQPSQGVVVVVDVEDGDVKAFDWGLVPSRNPIYPSSLAIGPFDDLYVADRANRRILVFDVNHRFSREITVEGAQGIADVKVDTSGRVYVVSTIDGAVHVFDVSGRNLLKFGTRGMGDGEFRFPVSLAVDPKGLIYVVDQHASTVLVFDRRGEFLFDFSRLGRREGHLHHPSYIFINRAGKIFVIDRQNSRVNLFE